MATATGRAMGGTGRRAVREGAPGRPPETRGTGTEAEQGVRSLERALEILVALEADGEARGVSEIARAVGIARSTAHRLLQVLVSRDFVTQDPESRRYSLGTAVVRLGRAAEEGFDVRREALPIMRRLQERTGETVNLNVERGGHRVCIEKVEGRYGIRHLVEIGKPLPLHAGASGKLLLAHLPDERIDSLFEVLELDRVAMREAIERIRSVGYAVSANERVEGAACVSAPIRDAAGIVVAGLSVSGPAFRFSVARTAEFVREVLAAAGQISRRLGYAGGRSAG